MAAVMVAVIVAAVVAAVFAGIVDVMAAAMGDAVDALRSSGAPFRAQRRTKWCCSSSSLVKCCVALWYWTGDDVELGLCFLGFVLLVGNSLVMLLVVILLVMLLVVMLYLVSMLITWLMLLVVMLDALLPPFGSCRLRWLALDSGRGCWRRLLAAVW
jgi:hypothetical protein